MAFYPIQNSFMAGEISSRMIGRMDTEWYKHGVEFSENFLHLPQGVARYRSGTEYIIDAFQNGGIRLIPFNVLSGPDVVLELGPGSARLVDGGGVIQLVSVPQAIVNNDFTSGSGAWSYTHGEGVFFQWMGSQATVNIAVPNYNGPTYPIPKPPDPPPFVNPSIRQKITVPAGNYRFQVSWLALTAADVAAGYHVGPGGRVRIGTTNGGTEVYTSLSHYNDSVDVNVTVPGFGNVDVWVVFDFNTTISPFLGAMTKVYFPRFTGAGGGPASLTGLPWTEAMLQGIQYAQDIRYGMVLVHPQMPPQKVVYNGSNFTVAAIVFTGAPADWTNGPPVNWPSTVEIWQSRLWLANTPDQPTTLWASSVGNYTNFAIPGTPAADDPIELSLATKGAIKWLRGKQSLLIGTELHEDVIVSATQVVSSLDAQLLRQSGYGSANIQAQEIGDQVLFVSRDQSKLRGMSFNFDTQAWWAHDITYYAQGITLPGIIDVAFQRDPDNTIFTVCTDGTMRMCTYDRVAEVTAWSRWRTQGTVLAVCATIDPAGTTIWLAVNRNGTTYIENIPAFTITTAPVFMDSFTSSVPTVYTPVGETTNRITISGLNHLNGFTVGVIVDGGYLGTAAVGAIIPNAVDMPFAGDTATTAIVGLLYTGTLRTLPLDGGVMYGSSAGLPKQRNKIFLRLVPPSHLPLINGVRPASQRYPATPMNTTSPLPEWDYWNIELGWDRYARVEIVQDQPFQTDVAALFGRAEVVQN